VAGLVRIVDARREELCECLWGCGPRKQRGGEPPLHAEKKHREWVEGILKNGTQLLDNDRFPIQAAAARKREEGAHTS